MTPPWALNNVYKKLSGELPGSPVVRTPRSHCRGPGAIPGRGTKIPPAAWCIQKQTNKQTNYLMTWR